MASIVKSRRSHRKHAPGVIIGSVHKSLSSRLGSYHKERRLCYSQDLLPKEITQLLIGPEYSNIPDAQVKDIKIVFINMMKVLKEEMNKFP